MLFFIPFLFYLKCIFFFFTNDQFNRTKLRLAVQNLTLLGSSDNSILAIVTAYEMLNAPQSPWLPLICNFPTTYPGLPFTWHDEQLRSVSHVPGFGSELRENVDVNLNNWAKLLSADLAFVNYNFGASIPSKFIIWAAFAIRSRSFGLPPALVPVADLLNHDGNPHVNVNLEMMLQPGQTEDQAVPGAVNMVLRRDVLAGEEVFNSYGAMCQRMWLSSYGYVPGEPDAPCDGEYV